jgi:putative ABC transport system ATP-binding protein
VLELHDVVKHYKVGAGEPVAAVDGVSMRVRRGEFLAMYGPSGSGKTTLIQLIAGLLRPDSGSVLVEERDVAQMSRRDAADFRRHVLGMVMHPETLIPGARAIRNASIKVMMNDARGAERTVAPLLARVGLGDRLQHRTEQLSMGERQRVLIALALSTDPKLVLADEPTGNLDTQNTRMILALLRDLCRDRSMALVLATHDPEVAAYADQVHELRDGRLHPYVPAPARVVESPLAGA